MPLNDDTDFLNLVHSDGIISYIHIDTISMKVSILYFKGCLSNFYRMICLSLKIVYIGP